MSLEDHELTKESVSIYQDIYYHHFKPLFKLNLNEKEIQKWLKPILRKFGWSWRKFEDFRAIDLMQRFVFEYSHELVSAGLKPLISKLEYRRYDPNYGALRLKNNLLSEDPDRVQ